MDNHRSGLVFGVSAYLLWGLFPLYWPLLEPAAPVEILAHRIVWSLVFVCALLALTAGFGWLRTLVPEKGFTSWEVVLAEVWLGLGAHEESKRHDFEEWIDDYYDSLPSKNAVRPPERRYAGMSIEEYARAASEGQVIPEWQEALNASPDLHERFLDIQRGMELEAMGVSKEEVAALDQIQDGQMDMHLRMAQQQQAVHAANADDDPDPLVFPGERVARLSDYISILRDMQRGDMNGALARFGLDMAGYTTVATAWGAKMAADPVLTEKFHRMLQP